MDFLNNNLIQTLCLAFLHSLWQAALLAVLAGFVLHFTRKTKPDFRYNLLGFLFLFFITGVVATFSYLWMGNTMDTKNIATGSVSGEENIVWSAKMINSLLQYFTAFSPVLFLVWLLFFLLKSIRLITAFKGAYRIKNYGIFPPDSFWQDRFGKLVETLKINRKIKLLESKIAKTPAVIGYVKPVVLLPLGLLAQLPTEQIEAILLHELAHIKRRDFLSNSIQKIVEIIFFFNPFLLWISKRLQEERENCCDEMVLEYTNDKKTLVNALISFQEYQFTALKLSLNFGNTKKQLLFRVKRIVMKQNRILNNMEKVFVTVSMFLFLGFLFSDSRPVKIIDPYPSITRNLNEELMIHQHEKIVLQNVVIESVNLSKNQDTLKIAHAITADLIQNGIIDNTNALSYKLNNEELIVNGMKQPITLHERLKEKYIHEQGWTLFYRHQEKEKSISNII